MGQNIEGKKFGDLEAIRLVKHSIFGRMEEWECRCICGKVITVVRCHLTRGKVKHCGCGNRGKLAHLKDIPGGKLPGYRSRIYQMWADMKSRCNNPNARQYRWYGGRGIKVCKEWEIFDMFYGDAIQLGYKDNLSIDRIDNDKGYYPGNVRFVTMKEQYKNKRITSKRYGYLGSDITITEWSKITGISCNTFYNRIRNGWTVQEALYIPKNGRRARWQKSSSSDRT